VKPANILFTETGTAKVVDFGLALFANRGGDQSGEIWATPYYVAPEKVIDNKEDYRSDIFSLGASLYHAMTGNPPHKADTNSIEELRRIKCKRVTLGDSGLRCSPRTEHVINGMLSFRPEDRFANYDEVVDEMRLAEGMLDRTGVRRRLFSRRAKLIGGIAAAVTLSYGVGWLLREGGERRATQKVIQITPGNDRDLDGGGVTLTAGKETVSERFAEARQEMLASRHFAQARPKFIKLAESKDVPASTANWARFNAGLCDIILGRKADAEIQFRKLSTDASVNGLAPFFAKIKERMSRNLALGVSLDSLDYRKDNEEILGYLAHGFAEWHFGSETVGAEVLGAFHDMLTDMKPVASTTTSLEWLSPYGDLVNYYKPDFPLVQTALKPRSSGTLEELRTTLAEVELTKKNLKTSGAFRSKIETRQSELKREIARMTLEQQQQQMEADKKRRQADLTLLGEVNALVPSLVQGYDYSRAIDLLGGTRLETEDVRSALDGRLYLHTQSRDFIRQITADLASKSWNGTITRREGGQMTGRIACTADGATVNVTLERGTLSIPFESLTPECLVEIAQFFSAEVTDSTDYYRRQEVIASFARLNGLTQLSATIAAQLMEENRSFRARWTKVMEAGI
jgi:hypothetical protein